MEKNLSNGAMLKKKFKKEEENKKNCSSLFFWLCTKYLFYCQYAPCELWFYWTRLGLRQSSRNLCAGMSGCKQHFETFSSKIWYWFLEVMVKEIGQQGGALVLLELGWAVPKNSGICVPCEVEFSSVQLVLEFKQFLWWGRIPDLPTTPGTRISQGAALHCCFGEVTLIIS